MAKTRLEKIESIKTEIAQLENQRKKLLQQQKEQERKDRTRRLCSRMGLFESMLPDTITLSDDLFKTFLEKAVLTEQSRRILDGLSTAQTAAAPAPSGAGSAALPHHPARDHTRQNRAMRGRGRGTGRGWRGEGGGLTVPFPRHEVRTYTP